jgi:hypothetical protein
MVCPDYLPFAEKIERPLLGAIRRESVFGI